MKGEGRSRRDESSSALVAVEADVEGGGEKPLPPQRSFAASAGRSRWGRSVLWAVLAVVLIECAFIVRLDILNTPATSVYSSTATKLPNPRTENLPLQESATLELPIGGTTKNATDVVASDEEGKVEEKEEEVIVTKTGDQEEENENENGVCSQEWLEQADRVVYSRNFTKQPVLVTMSETEVWDKCAVPCVFKGNGEGVPDAQFGLRDFSSAAQVLRSMESSAYFPDNDIDHAHKNGITVVMTTSLKSDVPVGYFSWAEYPLMDPPKKKAKQSLAAAFISNCGAHNDRLQIMSMLQSEGVPVDSYGLCDQNVPGSRGVNKVEALRDYKFSLSFENSNVEDYVTEKFFQALVAGTIPVVVGPPNIDEFAPGPNTLIYIKDTSEVKAAAAKMKYLASNETAYNETIRWKFDGPSDSFLALVDMAAVHSSCRLCIHLATKLRLQEEIAAANRPCKCTSEPGYTLHHLYVRERGRFETESIFIKDIDLTISNLIQAVLDKFTVLKHVPIWKTERPEVIRGDSKLRIYKIYPASLTQREALYTWSFGGDKGLKELVQKERCLKLEVIFV